MCIICTFRCLTHLGFWMLLTMQSWKKWMFWTWALEDLISWISLLLTRFVQKLCLYWHSMFRNACSNKMVKICQNGQICKYLLILMKFHQICLFFMAFISGHKWVFMYTFTVLVHMWKQQFPFCFWTIFRCSWKFICKEKLHRDISTCCNCSELLENVWQVL